MNYKRRGHLNVNSKQMPSGKYFNPYCVCHKRTCNGVKPAETGKLIFHLVQIFEFYFILFIYLLITKQKQLKFHLVLFSFDQLKCAQQIPQLIPIVIAQLYSDSETLSDSEGPYFITDESSNDNNGLLN